MSVPTEGPWAVCEGAIYGPETGPVHGGKTCAECGHHPTECGPLVIAPLDQALIRDVKAGHWDDYQGPSAADLQLAATARQMLSVLQELKESASYWSEYDVPLGIVDRIDAAIAAATEMPAESA